MINKEEYELLKELKVKGHRYLSRDKDNELCANVYRPFKASVKWSFRTNDLCIDREGFQFVQWEDEKPTYIPDLINEYEAHQKPKKVEIPQFVADWIEDWKTEVFIFEAMAFMTDDVKDWAMDNEEAFTRAWLDGYTIEPK